MGYQQWHGRRQLIADQIRERANPWTTLYDPMRRARKDFNKGGDSQSLIKLKDIRPGEGGVIKLGKGHVAVRKAASGALHALSASCTHEGWRYSQLTAKSFMVPRSNRWA
jgi:hypothetical protein